MKNTMAQLDILVVNHASATTLPETLPAFAEKRKANF